MHFFAARLFPTQFRTFEPQLEEPDVPRLDASAPTDALAAQVGGRGLAGGRLTRRSAFRCAGFTRMLGIFPPTPPPMIGSRRYLTILFADLAGSSELAERMEAEDFAELLAMLRRAAQDTMGRHGGLVARAQGDGLLALFGHDEPREDDGRRATEAALELHAAVRALRPPAREQLKLRLHSGIHAGLTLVSEGDIERGRVDVVGEVANTAARLCSEAAVDEILVSAESLGPAAHFFRLTSRGLIPIRGRSAPLHVLRVDGRAEVARRIDAAARRGTAPFVGRTEALESLLHAADVARRGERSALLVSGEPGIGKTRLLDEFRRQLDTATYFCAHGGCESYLAAEPLQPFLQALRGELGWRADATQEQLDEVAARALQVAEPSRRDELLPVLQAVLGRRGTKPGALRISGLVDLFFLLAGARVPVVMLDDWQWADDASRHALDVLRERQRPFFVILAARPFNEDDHALVGADTLRLQPLADTDARQAVTTWLPTADPFAIQALCTLAGGNPLFIEELCHATAAGGGTASLPRGSGVAWLNALVASRMARLPAPLADGLRVAAVAGNTFPAWLLQRLLDGVAGAASADMLAESDFIVDAGHGGVLRFKHALTREAIYATVPPARRRAVHLQVAELLEAADRNEVAFDALETLAYHYDAAGVPAKAADYAEAAGDRALAAMALDRGRAQYITALRALDALPLLDGPTRLRWCGIAQKLGQTCVFDPLDVADSLVLFRRAADLAQQSGDINVLARAEYWLGYVNYGKGQPRRAVRHGERALALATASGDDKLAAQVQATLAQALASSGDYARALPLFRQAVESKRRHATPGNTAAIGSAYTLGRLGYTFGDLGLFDEAAENFAEALHLMGERVHSVKASILELMSAVHLWQGRWADAVAAGTAGAELALRCRSRYLTSMGHALAACGAWAERRDPEALATLRGATLWIESRGGAVSTSLNHGWLVQAAVDQGERDEARRFGARLLQRARASDRHGLGQGCRALALLEAQHGQAPAAERLLSLAERAAAQRQSPREVALNQLARARLALLHGRATEARALADQAAGAFDAMQMEWHREQAGAVLG